MAPEGFDPFEAALLLRDHMVGCDHFTSEESAQEHYNAAADLLRWVVAKVKEECALSNTNSRATADAETRREYERNRKRAQRNARKTGQHEVAVLSQDVPQNVRDNVRDMSGTTPDSVSPQTPLLKISPSQISNKIQEKEEEREVERESKIAREVSGTMSGTTPGHVRDNVDEDSDETISPSPPLWLLLVRAWQDDVLRGMPLGDHHSHRKRFEGVGLACKARWPTDPVGGFKRALKPYLASCSEKKKTPQPRWFCEDFEQWAGSINGKAPEPPELAHWKALTARWKALKAAGDEAGARELEVPLRRAGEALNA